MPAIHHRLLALLLMLPILAGCSGDDTPSPSRHLAELNRADQLWLEGDTESALEILHAILETDTKSFEARYRQGVLRFRDKPREALQDFEAATALDPHHPGPRLFSGLVRLSLSDFEGADRDLAVAESRAWEQRGFSYPPPGEATLEGMEALNADQPGLARDAFSRALDTSHDRADLWTLYGMASFQAGSRVDAVEAAERALELDDQTAFAHVVLAATDLQTETDAARRHLDLALELQPMLGGAHRLYGLAWLRDSEYTKASISLWLAILNDPTVPETHFDLGRVLMSMRRNELASILMQQAEGVQQLLDRKYPPPNK